MARVLGGAAKLAAWVEWAGAAESINVDDKRHPFAGANRTGSTGVNLSRLSARHPVSKFQPSGPATRDVKMTVI